MIRSSITAMLAATALACTVTSAVAQATHVSDTITFNDLANTGPGGAQVPDGYKGFNFGQTGPTYYISKPADPGTPPDNYLAFSSLSAFSYFRSDRTEFYLDGVDFFSRRGLDAVGDVYFVLYRDGATVYNGLTEKDGRNVFTGTSSTFRPLVFDENSKTSSPYTGPIDGFALAFDNDDHDHLAMDNLQVRVISSVPEPHTHALLLAGLVMVGTVARRRHRAAQA